MIAYRRPYQVLSHEMALNGSDQRCIFSHFRDWKKVLEQSPLPNEGRMANILGTSWSPQNGEFRDPVSPIPRPEGLSSAFEWDTSCHLGLIKVTPIAPSKFHA